MPETQSVEIRINEVVRLTGWTRVYIYELINRGKITARRSEDPSRVYLVDKASLEHYLANRKRRAT